MSLYAIEIFKTDVRSRETASKILSDLRVTDPACDVHFDLKDCDRVLRVVSPKLNCEAVAAVVEAHGHWCERMES